MQLIEGRRLTGPSLWLDRPGAAVEVVFEPGDDADAAFAQLTFYSKCLQRIDHPLL